MKFELLIIPTKHEKYCFYKAITDEWDFKWRNNIGAVIWFSFLNMVVFFFFLLKNGNHMIKRANDTSQ